MRPCGARSGTGRGWDALHPHYLCANPGPPCACGRRAPSATRHRADHQQQGIRSALDRPEGWPPTGGQSSSVGCVSAPKSPRRALRQAQGERVGGPRWLESQAPAHERHRHIVQSAPGASVRWPGPRVSAAGMRPSSLQGGIHGVPRAGAAHRSRAPTPERPGGRPSTGSGRTGGWAQVAQKPGTSARTPGKRPSTGSGRTGQWLQVRMPND